jgi:hypothetical protein
MTGIVEMAEKKKRSFYSKSLDELERVELRNAAALEGIDEELALIRFRIKRLVKLSKNKDEDLSNYINVLCRALVTQKAIGASGTKQLKTAIGNVVRDILIPLGVNIGTAAITKKL